MRIRFAGLVVFSIAVLAGLNAMPNLMGQGKAAKAEKADKQEKANIQGTVQSISKSPSMITVRTSGTLTRPVVYTATTKFLYGHSNDAKPGNVAQIKESYFISCGGTFDAKAQLMATECVYREAK